MRLRGRGLEVDLPPGWEGRIHLREPERGATTHAVLHAATFPLPEERGDFGDGVVERMRATDAFVALVEYDRGAASTALFSRRGIPSGIVARSLRPDRMHRHIPGQAGVQYFFSERGRAFCLYVVVGSLAGRPGLTARVNSLLKTLRIEE